MSGLCTYAMDDFQENMFSNLHDFFVNFPDKLSDANSFDFNAEENSSPALWNVAFLSINQTAQGTMDYENFGEVGLGIDISKKSEEIPLLCNDDLQMLDDCDTDTNNSTDFDLMSSESVFNKPASNLTLSSINETFEESSVEDSFGMKETDIFGDIDENKENLLECLGEQDFEFNDNFSMYEELSDLESILNGIMEESDNNGMKDNFNCSIENNTTKPVSNNVIQVKVSDKLFYVKDAKIVLERLPVPEVKSKKPKASKSAIEKTSSYKFFDRYCFQCKKIMDKNSIRNDVKCKTCKTKLIFQCKKCYVKCETYGRMMYHVKTKLCEFQTSEKNCTKCGKNYDTINNLKRHFTCCKQEVLFHCIPCAYKTNNNKNLKKHMQSIRHNQIAQIGNLNTELDSRDVNSFV